MRREGGTGKGLTHRRSSTAVPATSLRVMWLFASRVTILVWRGCRKLDNTGRTRPDDRRADPIINVLLGDCQSKHGPSVGDNVLIGEDGVWLLNTMARCWLQKT